MSAATAFLATLQSRGVELRVDGDRIRWAGPKGAVGPDDLAQLRQHKPELLALLSAAGTLPLASDPAVPSAETVRHLAGYVREARWLLGALVVVVPVLHQEYAKDAAREGVQPVPLEVFRLAYEAEPAPLRNACRDDKEALVLIEEPAQTDGGSREGAGRPASDIQCDNVTLNQEPTRADDGGNSASYRIRRLKRDRPEGGAAA